MCGVWNWATFSAWVVLSSLFSLHALIMQDQLNGCMPIAQVEATSKPRTMETGVSHADPSQPWSFEGLSRLQ